MGGEGTEPVAQRGVGPFEGAPARCGQFVANATAVVRVGRALDELTGDEAVDQRGHGRGADGQVIGEAGGQLGPAGQKHQQAILRKRQLDRAQRNVETLAQASSRPHCGCTHLLRLPKYSCYVGNSYAILSEVGGKRAAALFAAVVLLVLQGASLAHASAPTDAVDRAARYLVSRQLDDGSWPSQSGAATADVVADYAVALAAADVSGPPMTKALGYVAAHGPADANRASATSRVILAAVAGGKDPRDFGHVDYVGRLGGYYNPTTGDYDAATQSNALAVLALTAAGQKPPSHAIGALQARQCSDGGFSRSTCLLGSDAETTALAVSALTAAGVGTSDPAVGSARGYLAAGENADGGFANSASGATAAEPTGAVVVALSAIGENPQAAPWRKSATADPWAALVALQDQSGGLRTDMTTTGPDDQGTARALPGFAGVMLPVRPHPVSTPATRRDDGAAISGSTTTISPAAATATTLKRPPRRGARTTTAVTPAPNASGKTDLRLAAPSRDGGHGRSLLRLLPFVLTLVGAGAAGLLLRRRAHT